MANLISLFYDEKKLAQMKDSGRTETYLKQNKSTLIFEDSIR